MLNSAPLNDYPLNGEAEEGDKASAPLRVQVFEQGEYVAPVVVRVWHGVGYRVAALTAHVFDYGDVAGALAVRVSLGTGTALVPVVAHVFDHGESLAAMLVRVSQGTGKGVAALAINVAAAQGKAATWLKVRVVSLPGTVAAALSVVVTHPHAAIAAPLKVRVWAAGKAVAGLGVAVSAPGNPPPPVDGVTPWTATVMLSGADVSARITGEIEVEAEEGAARIATFALVPAGGPVDPFVWVGATVVIDAGFGVQRRIFTGVVETPEYDPITTITRFRCTDGLQGKLDQMMRAQIDTLIGGEWSHVIFDFGSVGQAYADEQLSTVAAAVECDAQGAPRRTLWAAKSSPDVTLTEAEIFDESLSISLAGRSGIKNRFKLAVEYRYPIIKERRWNYRWDHPDDSLYKIMQHSPTFPTREHVTGAIDGCNWHLVESHYKQLPVQQWWQPAGGSWALWIISPETRDSLVWGFGALFAMRYHQEATEKWSVVVESPDSIAQLGAIEEEVSVGLAVDAADEIAEWEKDYAREPILPVLGEGEAVKSLTEQEIDGRPVFEAASRCAVARATVAILAAHRSTRVGASIVFDGRRDLAETIRINTSPILAKGKVSRLRHRLDIDSGAAVTELEIAISTIAATGLPASDPIEIPPEAPKPESPTAKPSALRSMGDTFVSSGQPAPALIEFPNGYIGRDVKETAGKDETEFPPTEFRITPPDIPDDDRDPLDLEQASSTFRVAIPQDQLSLAA